MKLNLNKGQLEKLSDLSMDIAKGLIVSAFVVPIFEHSISLAGSLFSSAVGLLFVALSLTMEKEKEKST